MDEWMTEVETRKQVDMWMLVYSEMSGCWGCLRMRWMRKQ